MSITTEFSNQLNSNAAGSTLVVDGDPRHLTCQIETCDSLAVSFLELQIDTSELANVSVPDLQRISESLSQRLTYLLEPIAPIEADTDQCAVQMRSNPPQKDDDGRSYYELLVRRGGSLSLVRYRKEPGTPRTQVAAQVTKEVLNRLASDFCTTMDEFTAIDK